MPRACEATPAGAGGRRAALGVFLAGAMVLLVLPAAGALLAGRPAATYLEFPPLSRYVAPAAFSWPVFVAMGTFVVACVTPLLAIVARTPAPRTPPRGRFPAWGWAALAFTLAAWAVAWSRLPLFAPLQIHTFTPLWLGYIGTVNALCQWRAGHCPLLDDTRRYLALFPASALFWWLFEYLNRFVQNWYYTGIDTLGAAEYVLWSTLAFSTVLPAVAATRTLLGTWPRLTAGLQAARPVRLPAGAGACLLALAVAGLAVLAVWPDWTFPLVWLAPLALFGALEARAGMHTPFAPVAGGDWREVWSWALAALVCGIAWETWNAFSAARWVYAVPFVQRFHIFEMPLLGYAGYLPFGLECALACRLARELVGDDTAGTASA